MKNLLNKFTLRKQPRSVYISLDSYN